MTRQELKNEIKRIQHEAFYNKQDEQTSKQYCEFIVLKDKYIVKGGYDNYYVRVNSKKDELENMLEATINACYDIYGYCF